MPQATEASVKKCFGAVLSPDGDHFYTVHEGLLTQYQIKPFKKIGSIAINLAQFKERQDDRCRILITNDKSKLIITFYDKMLLLDAKTSQILNKFERTGAARRIDAVALNENELVILETEHESYFHNLTIWDADTLKLKREIRDLGENFGFVPDQTYSAMFNILGRIYLVNSTHLAVLNSKTYAPELTLFQTYSNPPKASKNFQKLFVKNVLKLTDHRNGKHSTFDDVKGESVLVFDQETRKSKIEKLNNIPPDEFAPGYVAYPGRSSSYSKRYVMIAGKSPASALLANLNTGGIVQFKYESGEAIMLDRDPIHVRP